MKDTIFYVDIYKESRDFNADDLYLISSTIEENQKLASHISCSILQEYYLSKQQTALLICLQNICIFQTHLSCEKARLSTSYKHSKDTANPSLSCSENIQNIYSIMCLLHQMMTPNKHFDGCSGTLVISTLSSWSSSVMLFKIMIKSNKLLKYSCCEIKASKIYVIHWTLCCIIRKESYTVKSKFSQEFHYFRNFLI